MAVKVYGVRIEEDTTKAFKKACESLPVSLKATVLIESYMKYIIQSIEEYKKGGALKIELKTDTKEILLVNRDSKDFIVFNGVASEIKDNGNK